jgi:hypothetical protein
MMKNGKPYSGMMGFMGIMRIMGMRGMMEYG